MKTAFELLQEELDITIAQLQKVAILTNALHRISTNDGFGPHGNLNAEMMSQIAREALAEFRLSWEPRVTKGMPDGT